MAHLFIFGLGYSAKRIKRSLERIGWTVEATGSEGDIAFADEQAVRAALGRASHVLSSVPPSDQADPVLEARGSFACPASTALAAARSSGFAKARRAGSTCRGKSSAASMSPTSRLA